MQAVFVHSDRFDGVTLAQGHPFRPVRARHTLDLCRREGLIDRDGVAVVEPSGFDHAELARFHHADYLDALRRANDGFHEDLLSYNLGRAECPVFPGVFDYATLCVDAALTGVDALLAGARVAFVPAGGMHHAMPDRAEGFCYLDDAVLAAMRLRDAGLRVAYVDIDAHHGNGVQRAFLADANPLVVSIHESGETLYPFGGFEHEIGDGAGRGHTVNFPLPVDTDDELYLAVFEAVVEPLLQAHGPDVVVLVMGVDTLAQDPMTHLKLTNNAIERVVGRVAALGAPVLALGGGGYELDAAARAWTLGWAALNGFALDDPAAGIGGALLGSTELGGGSLRDRQVLVTGEARRRNVEACVRVESYLRREVFPIHGL